MAFEAGTCWFEFLASISNARIIGRCKDLQLKSCEHCVLGKKIKEKVSTVIHHTDGLLVFVHMDVWGPTKMASLGGHQYFVSFVNDLSRYYWVYSMRQKFEVLYLLVKWKKFMEKRLAGRSKCFNLIILKSIIGISSCNLIRTMVLVFTSEFEKRLGWLKS